MTSEVGAMGSTKGKKKRTVSGSREEIRFKRRRRRKRIVMLQRAGIALLTIGVIGGGGFAAIWNLPQVKLDRQLSTGMEYTQEAAYDEAIDAYEKALKIDATSVKAYSCMAGAYLDMEDASHAKQILFEGWENTQDESLLEYYCTVILNEAVEDINHDQVSFETAEKILDVKKKPDHD